MILPLDTSHNHKLFSSKYLSPTTLFLFPLSFFFIYSNYINRRMHPVRFASPTMRTTRSSASFLAATTTTGTAWINGSLQIRPAPSANVMLTNPLLLQYSPPLLRLPLPLLLPHPSPPLPTIRHKVPWSLLHHLPHHLPQPLLPSLVPLLPLLPLLPRLWKMRLCKTLYCVF